METDKVKKIDTNELKYDIIDALLHDLRYLNDCKETGAAIASLIEKLRKCKLIVEEH